MSTGWTIGIIGDRWVGSRYGDGALTWTGTIEPAHEDFAGVIEERWTVKVNGREGSDTWHQVTPDEAVLLTVAELVRDRRHKR